MNINFETMNSVELLKLAEKAVQIYITNNSPSKGGDRDNYSWGVSIRDFLYALSRKEEKLTANDEYGAEWHEKELKFITSFLYDEKVKG